MATRTVTRQELREIILAQVSEPPSIGALYSTAEQLADPPAWDSDIAAAWDLMDCLRNFNVPQHEHIKFCREWGPASIWSQPADKAALWISRRVAEILTGDEIEVTDAN